MKKMHGKIMFAAIFLFSLKSGLAIAQESKRYPLSLEDVTRLAIANNFDIQLAQYDKLIAEKSRGVVKAIFDTMLSADVNYRNNQNKTASTYLGTKTLDNNYNIGLSKKLPSGTTVSVDMANNRNWTDSSFATSPLIHDSSLGFSLTQELGRNFFGLQDRGKVRINALDIEGSGYTSYDRIETDIVQVQKAYWDLVLQKQLVVIKEDMVDQARKLYELHQEKLKDGLVEKPEAIASEANYKNSINDLAIAKNNVTLKENILKILLNIEDNSLRIEPKETLALSDSIVNGQDALRTAFENRRDYQKAKIEVDSKNIQVAMNKNSLWPEINLTASLNRNGLGDHFNQAVTNITDEDNPDFFAGISIRVPIENSKAKAELSQAKLDKAKALVNLKLIEKKIAIGIIDQVRNCRIFKEVAKNSVEVSDLQEQKLQAEGKRYNSGRSSTDMIIRYQQDVLNAREASANAKYRYKTSLIDLEKTKGTLLGKYIEEK